RWMRFIHTSRFVGWMVALLTLFTTVLLVVFSQRTDEFFLTVDQIAPRPIFSQIAFSYTDEDATKAAKNAAENATPPAYQIRMQDMARDVELFASQLEDLAAPSAPRLPKPDQDRLAQLWNQRLSSSLTGDDMPLLIQMPDKAEVIRVVRALIWEIGRRGIEEPEQFVDPNLNINTYVGETPTSRDLELRRAGDFYSVQEARDQLARQLRRRVSLPDKYYPVLEKAVLGILRPNMSLNEPMTERLKAINRDRVQPVVLKIEPGRALVNRGEKITKSRIALLKAYSEAKNARDKAENMFQQYCGKIALIVLLFVAGILVLSSQLFRNHPTTNREYALLASIVLLQLLVARVVLDFSAIFSWPSPGLVPYLLMPAFGPMLTTVLTNTRRANLIALLTSFFLSILADNNFIVLVYSVVTGVVSVNLAKGVRRRFQIMKAGLGAGVAGMLCALAFAAYLQVDPPSALWQGMASIIAGLISALMISSVVPVYEWIFKVTTDLRWLELTDLNHPLLRRLFMEAPGTYHHSLSVAHLAEAATEEIGGNSLQARVCSLFHDIGKLVKPEYFTENIRGRENPHDNLAPHMSALILVAHVKEGVNFALQYRLNPEIIDVIKEHHGTSKIFYFYHRAKQLEKDALEGSKILNLPEEDVPRVDEETYRYPGPKPQTRECGVVSLADAVEGASRSLGHPTPQRVEAMIKEIVFGKLKDGQLDECSLTLNDLNKIAESFTFNLVNMLHARVSYPKDDLEPEKSAPEVPAASS
ncbi:MAG: HDIG domain-containing protein, partial [Verrucomicrobiae bacterium]|nr:HDIG domain-containing protein [Verrucomicrobiae bacterium]